MAAAIRPLGPADAGLMPWPQVCPTAKSSYDSGDSRDSGTWRGHEAGARGPPGYAAPVRSARQARPVRARPSL